MLVSIQAQRYFPRCEEITDALLKESKQHAGPISEREKIIPEREDDLLTLNLIRKLSAPACEPNGGVSKVGELGV
jgi:hypothetical protein